MSVRQKVLTAQLKILSNLETSVVEEALRPVPYASFLASILSQEDHPSLVMFALQASELLFERLEDIYQYQFHREGVIGEIQKLADRALELDDKLHSLKAVESADSHPNTEIEPITGDDLSLNEKSNEPQEEVEADEEDQDEEDGEGANHHDEEAEDEDEVDEPEEEEIVIRDHVIEDDSDSSDEDIPSPIAIAGINDLVILRARKFLERYDNDRGRELKDKACKIRDDLRTIAGNIEASYTTGKPSDGSRLFDRLAKYFRGDALESITSSELLDSGIIGVLGLVLAGETAPTFKGIPRGDFLASFMGTTTAAKIKTTTATSASTPLSVLIHKLQDLLSRAEHFEVLTVNNNAAESSRSSSASMLARQIRLRLSAEEGTDIPQSYREMVVSIHAIAVLRSLEDYLRPRFMTDRPAVMSRRREMLQQLANARMAQISGAAESGLFSPFGQELGSPLPPDAEGLASSRPSSRSKPSSQSKSGNEPKPTPKAEKRRSTRKSAAASSANDALPPPEPRTEATEPKLEIADEKPIHDETGTPASGEEALEAFVDGLDEDMSDEDMAEPAAVNMEIASTGKVTARREDGTRIVTPQPGTPVPGSQRTASSSDSPGLPPFTKGLPTAGRPSYAAALASVPQDWHLEFSIDGKVIPPQTTIYRAVHHNRDQTVDPVARGVWSGVHTIKFKKVKGPPPPQPSLGVQQDHKEYDDNELPASLDGHPITSTILSLLRILHELNASIDDVRETLGRAGLKLYAEPLASFINTKLTAKMNRQLEEPLIVASSCLPDWAEDVARSFPFLFPFETRHLFLQSTSFGYARSMVRWQNNQAENDDRRDRRRDDRPSMGRPQRQKVRISRNKILESAIKVMNLYGAGASVLEVEYFEEVGTGLGPTLEFFSTVSKEFSTKRLQLWRDNDSNAATDFVFGKNGLFPAPMSDADAKSESGRTKLSSFKALGIFVARSMLDSRIIDISINPTFFKIGFNSSLPLSIALLRTIDQDLANSIALLQQFANAKTNIEEKKWTATQKVTALKDVTIKGARIEDMMLDFTLPGYASIELVPGGSNVSVTIDNVADYIQRVLDYSLGRGVRRQVDAFKKGFGLVFAFSSLRAFTPAELVMLFGRVEEDWSIETLMDSVKADHGFNMDSKSVKNLLQTMSELSKEQRRDFLQFVTGSPKLPIGGFKSLTPMFTVVCKPSEPPYTSDDYLPSVMTCVNYLKLPDYSSQEKLRERLGVAIKEGQGAFHLS